MNIKNTKGFTLIELLVVVSILAALAGITSVAMDGYYEDSQEQITRVEMQRIANAIRRFKADTGYWPKTGPFAYDNTTLTPVSATKPVASYSMEDYRDEYFNSAANFWWLFDQPTIYIGKWDADNNGSNTAKIWKWDVESGMGWHGPYINYDAIKTVTIDGASEGCSTYTQTQLQGIIDKPHTSYPDHIVRRFNGLVDRFEQTRSSNTGKDFCVLTRDEKKMDEFKVADYSGSPYLYRTDYPSNSHCSGTTCIVLQSFGENGVEESDESGMSAEELEKIDDIVFVLQINE